MPHYELTQPEIEEVLRGERVVRIGFDVGSDRFLVPLGYLWYDGALYGMTTRGRKTTMGALNPHVSFQVDTSEKTGLFTWSSVSGAGEFALVTDGKEIETVSPLLFARFSDMPEWMQAEYAEKQAKNEVVYIRIRPTHLTGRRHSPP
jgi:nitroimidazol reductase NimA-like FMN-containing flavoprotein (pyridoxamine 5'-phosphate oxidase superfamily)